MMKRYFRWPTLLIFAALVVAALVPAFSRWHGGLVGAQAAGTTTISVIGTVFYPNETMSITAQGFAANDKVDIVLGDLTYGIRIGSIACDSNGNCAGKVKLPMFPGIEGQDGLYGLGTVQAEEPAQTTITIKPRLYALSGGPDARVILYGAAFAETETVQIYWGTKQGRLEGAVTTDYTGRLDLVFSIPVSLAPGSYQITAVRSNQKPAQVITTFDLLPPQVTTAPGISNGQTVPVHLSGFESGEPVSLSWSANGGQSLTSITVDGGGAATSMLTFLFAPAGAYVLTARGQVSRLQATASINIGPGIALSPATASPGATISVSGGGYKAGKVVQVYFQTITSGIVSTTVNASGNFTVSLKVPLTYQSGTFYYVYAVSTTGSQQASAQFFFTKPTLTLSGNPVYGQSFSYQGSGFGAGETVTLWANYQLPSQVELGTVVAASDGSISGSFTAPSVPYQLNTHSAPFNVLATGNTSLVSAQANMTERASFTLNPSSGTAGNSIHITGGSFAAHEIVAIMFGSTLAATATTDASGAFTASYTLPASTGPGQIYVTVKGQLSGIWLASFFVVK